MAYTTAALTRLKPVWNDKSISLSFKIRLMHSLLTSTFCMLVNHGPSQQSSKEEYKPWKWGATARYYASHTKTMLPTRKSMPRSSRQLDHTWRPPHRRKEAQTAVVWTCLPFIKSGQNHLARHSGCRKTTSGNGQVWSSQKSQRAVENRGKWRKLTVKSSVVTQRLSRLRDRW